MSVLRRIGKAVLGIVDAWYYRRYRLRTLGPVLLLGHARYRGPELRFEDGTLLRDNDPIGRLHFNNASIAALGYKLELNEFFADQARLAGATDPESLAVQLTMML